MKFVIPGKKYKLKGLDKVVEVKLVQITYAPNQEPTVIVFYEYDNVTIFIHEKEFLSEIEKEIE